MVPNDDDIPDLDLSGQDDEGDPTALLEAHKDEIFSEQEPDEEAGGE